MVVLRLRRWSRALSLVLLLASVRGLPHLEGDDLACLPQAEQHDETRHGIRPAGALHQPDHCDVCHLTRSLRAPRPAPVTWGAQAQPAARILRERPELPHPPALDQLPARAPPAPRF